MTCPSILLGGSALLLVAAVVFYLLVTDRKFEKQWAEHERMLKQKERERRR